MRMAHYLTFALGCVLLSARVAHADPPAANPNDNPALQMDPDGVPLSVTHPDTRLTPEEAEAERKQQEQAAIDKDWLLRGYEKQLHDHSDSSQTQDSNLYYQLSSNKELARLAGLPEIDTGSQHAGSAYDTSAALARQSEAAGADGKTQASGYSLVPTSPFKPFITPLNSSDALGLHTFYSSLTTPLLGAPRSQSAPAATPSSDPADLDTPGMVAAEKDPLSDSSLTDPSLEVLPGESIEEARARQDNGNLELAVPMNAEELHRQEAAALAVPAAVGSTPATNSLTNVVPVAPIADPEAPTPVSKTLPINPIRSPIANPFDILNR